MMAAEPSPYTVCRSNRPIEPPGSWHIDEESSEARRHLPIVANTVQLIASLLEKLQERASIEQ